MVAAAVTDILERRRAQGASTLTQQLARNLKDHFGLTSKSQETTPKHSSGRSKRSSWPSDREALHEKGNLHHLLQPDDLGQGLWHRSRLPSVFQQGNKQLSLEEAALMPGSFRRRSAESLRRYEARDITQKRRAAADGGERYIAQAQAEAAKQKPIVTRGQPTQPPALRRSSSRTSASTSSASTARRCVRKRPLGDDHPRREAAGDREQIT